MKKAELVSLFFGIFIGLILLSMTLGRIDWEVKASVIIAICALALTVWQGYTTRKHYKLSLMPALCSWIGTTCNKKEASFKYTLINKGHGTATITAFLFYVRGIEVTSKEFEHSLHEMSGKLGTNENNISLSELSPGSFIETGEKIDVFNVIFDNQVNYSELLDQTENYSIVIEYSSMYGTKATYKSDWLELKG